MKLEFEEALAKLRIQATDIQVSQLPNGKNKASITVSSAPYQFTTEPSPTPLTAKSKLMYTALTYIHDVLGYGIIDLNHEVRVCIENHIRRFDDRINVVWQCGGRLVKISTSIIEQFTKMLVDIQSKISVDSAANQVVEAMADSATRIAQSRDLFGMALATFITKRVIIAYIHPSCYYLLISLHKTPTTNYFITSSSTHS